MNRPLACLSVRQPWASLLVHFIKPIENRAWYCAHRGPIVIHAGRTWKADEEAAYRELLQIAVDLGDRHRQDVLFQSRSLLGGFVGAINMVDCIDEKTWYARGGRPYDGRHEWFTGPFGFRSDRAQAFPELVPYKGMQGLFRVPRHHVPYALAV